MNKKELTADYLKYLASCLSSERLREYLAAITNFSNFNRKLKKHLLFKELFHAPLTALSREAIPQQKNYSQLIAERRSITKFSPSSVNCERLACIFKLGFSFLNTSKNLATCPSVGGLYSTEVYLLCLNVDGLSRGIYHYNVVEFALELISTFDLFESNKYFADENIDFENAAGIFLFTSKPALAEKKYLFRAWRLLYLEVGHFMMSFWLSLVNEGLGASSLGGGMDIEISKLLEIDGQEECFIGSVVFGEVQK